MRYEKTIIGIVCAVVILLMQITVYPGHDANDLRFSFMVGAGLIGFAYLFFTGKIGMREIIIMAPLSWLIIQGFAWYVPGYTGFEMVEYIGMLGLMFLVSRGESQYVWRALAAMILIQAAFTFLPVHKLYGIPKLWGNSYEGLKTEHNLLLYGFGTVRHRIRFATLMFVGVVACIMMVTNPKENPWWKGAAISTGLLGLFLMWYSFSNTILLCCILTAIALIAEKKPRMAGTLFVLVGITGTLLILGEKFGFVIDEPRKIMWKVALAGTFDSAKHAFFGHGLESWELFTGILPQVNGVGHPHNEYLKLLFENGIVGMLCLFNSLIMIIMFSERKFIPCFGFSMLLLSFATNGMTSYVDMFSITAIMGGLVLGEAKE